MNATPVKLVGWVGAGLVLLGLCWSPVVADSPTDAEARLSADLKFLAGAPCEGRGLTTKGIELAAVYLARQFQQAGLKPAGPDGSYYQPFTLVTAGKVAPSSQAVLRGPLGQTITLEAGKHFSVSLLGSSGQVEAPVVFAGYGITSSAPPYDDYAGLDVAGKVVLVLTGTPRVGHRYANVFAAAAAADGRPSSHASLPAKLANAERHKAAAVLVVNDRFSASLLRDNLPRATLSLPQSEPARLPVVHLRRETVDPMLVSAGTSLAQLEQAIDADLKPLSRPLTGWNCRLQAEVSHTRITVKNVLGVLEGEGPLAKETVVIGAHYDHVGFGMGGRFGGFGGGVSGPGSPGGTGFPLSQMGGSAIHYGADDNASGTVALLEVARRLGALPNRLGRRLLFIAFTAEESGLLGSAYYCRQPVFPLEDTTTMINMDMVGRLQDNRLMIGGLGTAKPFAPLIERLNEQHGFDLFREASGQGPSDHASFYQRQIPVLKFFTGFHEQYHRPTDRIETLNVPGIRRIAELVTDVVAEMRSLQPRPEYAKTGTYNRRTTLWAAAPATGIVLDYADTKEGVLLTGVVNSTPAAKAGLQQGDRLVALKGQPVRDPATFHALTRALNPGETIPLTVERGGQRQDLVMHLARAPAGLLDARFGFSLDATDSKDGLLLTEVPVNSPAAKAGLQKGDRLIALAGAPIQDVQSYFQLVRTFQPGETVLVTVSRDGGDRQVQVQTAEMSRGQNVLTRFGLVPGAGDSHAGVLVTRVEENTPAARAGLRAGDRITALNGQPLEDVRALTQTLMDLREGDKIELAIVRDGTTHPLQAVLR